MLRDKNLIPLSHQHQRALALCVRIDRAQPISEADLPAWQAEIEHLYNQEIEAHFSAEEEILFPGARQHTELIPLVEELTNDHIALREFFSRTHDEKMFEESLVAFARTLSAHIRKEERQLFEGMQRLMSAEELAALGRLLEAAFEDVEQSCTLPNETTKLQPKP
jgi:hemerythrin-like domain-containing protein